jgi:sterol desaturase/sphingolipid hydroxylase (fatty acid hydroxylase superfamily)
VAFLGVLGLSATGIWLAVIGAGALRSAGELSSMFDAPRGSMIGPGVLIVVLVLFLAERRWPAVPRRATARAHLVDGGYLVLFALVIAPLLVLVETGFAVEFERHAGFLVLGRLPLLPRVLVVGLILVLMDAANWAVHVANHRHRALWRLHALHHSQEEMSVLTTFRTHPLMHLAYVPAVLPALFLGASGTVSSAALIAYGCLVTVPHANLGWRFGPFGQLLVSPAYHRLHHAPVPVGARGVVNFGFVLVCWDRLAGCASFARSAEPTPTGIAGRPVPVEQSARGWGVPRVFLEQLLQPLRRDAGLEANS